MHVLLFLCDDGRLACPVCVIVTMIVTLHAGKSMVTNMVVSKTMHYNPTRVKTLSARWYAVAYRATRSFRLEKRLLFENGINQILINN